jgi:hypothetical protein
MAKKKGATVPVSPSWHRELSMHQKGTVAVASAVFVVMAPAVAQAYGVEGLYERLTLVFGLPVLLALIGGFVVGSYLRAVAVAMIAGLSGIALWSYDIGAVRLDPFHGYFVVALVLMALAAHALRRYCMSELSS